jgi:hypothetical protein
VIENSKLSQQQQIREKKDKINNEGWRKIKMDP